MNGMDSRNDGSRLLLSQWLTIAGGIVAVAVAIGLTSMQREIGLSNATLLGLGLASLAIPWVQSFKWGKDGFELITAQKATTTTLDELQKSIEKLNADLLGLAKTTAAIAAEVDAVKAALPGGANLPAASPPALENQPMRSLAEIVLSVTENNAAIQTIGGVVTSLKSLVYDTDPKP